MSNDPLKDLGTQSSERVQPVPARKGLTLPSLTFRHIIVGLLTLNLVVTGALWLRVMLNPRPVIATVGLTSLARSYAQSLANDPNISPDALEVRTKLFMAEGQKEIDRLTQDGGMVLLARECVLKGEDIDLTPQFAASLNQQLAATNSPQLGGSINAPDR